MIYLSIDTETTGLNEKENQLIEFAAIIEDTDNPQPFDDLRKFRRIVLNRNDRYVFQSFACNLNKKLIEEIAYLTPLIKRHDHADSIMKIRNFFTQPLIPKCENWWCYDDELGAEFKYWLDSREIKQPFVIGGKNVGFDTKFMNATPNFSDYIKYRHRHLDPAQSFVDWRFDKEPPSLELCKERAGLPTEVTHRALEDAWDVIMLMRIAIERSKPVQLPPQVVTVTSLK